MNKSKYVHALNTLHFVAIVHPTATGHVAISRKDGSLLQVVEGEKDRTLELGGSIPFDGSPICKEQRLFELDKHENVVSHPKQAERLPVAKKMVDDRGVALSIKALEEKGYEFKKDLSILSVPQQESAQ